MRYPIRTLLLAGALCATAPLAQAQLKVGIVDMNKAFTEYYKTKDAEQKLNEQRSMAKKEYDDRVETLKKLMEDINKINTDIERPELSKDAKDAKVKDREAKVGEARNLDKEIGEFRATREKQLQEQYMRMRKDIVDDIMQIVNTEVTGAGYDIVFDKSGLSILQVPVVVYSRDDLDFTTAVIKKLNSMAPKVKPAQ